MKSQDHFRNQSSNARRIANDVSAYDPDIATISSIDPTTGNPILSINGDTGAKPDRCSIPYDGIHRMADAGMRAAFGRDVTGRRLIAGDPTDQPLMTNHYKLFPKDHIDSETNVGFLTANQVRCVRVFWERAVRIATIKLWCQDAGTTGKIGIGIYSPDGNTRHLTTGAVTLNTLQVVDINITDQVQQAGHFIIAWTINNTDGLIGCVPAFSTNALQVLNAGIVQTGTAANAAADAVLPATLGTITGASFAIPIFKFQS